MISIICVQSGIQEYFLRSVVCYLKQLLDSITSGMGTTCIALTFDYVCLLFEIFEKQNVQTVDSNVCSERNPKKYHLLSKVR